MNSVVEVLEFLLVRLIRSLVGMEAVRMLRCGPLAACLLVTAGTACCAGQAAPADKYQQAILQIQEEIEAGQLEAAREMIAAAALKYPHDGGIENLQGVVEIEQGHTAAAEKAFSTAITHNPRLTSAYLNLSRIKMSAAMNDPPARAEALRLSRKVLQLDSGNDEARYQAATVHFWNKQYQLSLHDLHELSPDASVKVGAQALACADAAAMGDRNATDKAAEALASNADLAEEDANTCVPPLRASRRADLIVRLLSSVAAHRPLSAAGQHMLGLAQEGEGKFPEARATLEAAFASQPASVEILKDLARVAKQGGDNQGALGYLAHARDLQPQDASLAYEFGAVCVRMGLLAEARKAIAEALRIEPENPDYNLGMGTVVSFSADPPQALPYLTKYHALRPHDPQGLLALGTANYRAKDFDTAAKWLAEAAHSRETAADAHFYLGRIARQEGKPDEAAAELKQSLAARPDQPDALAELGQISTQKRAFAEASAYFDRALRSDPDNYGANYGLLQLYARTGDSRREQQSRKFDEVKNLRDEQEKQMMRIIEIRRSGSTDEPKTF